MEVTRDNTLESWTHALGGLLDDFLPLQEPDEVPPAWVPLLDLAGGGDGAGTWVDLPGMSGDGAGAGVGVQAGPRFGGSGGVGMAGRRVCRRARIGQGGSLAARRDTAGPGQWVALHDRH